MGERMSGLSWKRNADEILERRRRFFRREMMDGILATLPVRVDAEDEWQAFEKKWGTYPEGEPRPFPSNEEVFERSVMGLEERGKAEDDWLPVDYSILDAGESMVGAMFGRPVKFYHRPRSAAFSKAESVVPDYAQLPDLSFSPDNEWARRFLSIQEYFEEHSSGRFAQHPCLTMDALNFVCEMREATRAYLDVYEYPDEMKRLMDIGLDFNIRFQEAQMERIAAHADGCFVWLGDWVPFDRAISLSVDAYVVCSPATYAEFGFDWQRRLIEHFGHGLMHFHCNRTDLAAEVAKLPNLELFQFGGDSRDPVPSVDRVPEMRQAVGDIPILVDCPLDRFRTGLSEGTLIPNVCYQVTSNHPLSIDEANRLAGAVRAYRA